MTDQAKNSVNAHNLVELIRAVEPEIIADAAAGTTFSQMEFDSLSMVEIAVIITESYGCRIEDWEVARAGSFPELANLVNARLAIQSAP